MLIFKNGKLVLEEYFQGHKYQWDARNYHGDMVQWDRAGGWGGQEIMIFPELDMVVVFTGGNYASKTTLFELIEKYVLPAVP